MFCAYPKCIAVACRMYVSRHFYNFSLNSRCLEQTCYKCFFDSFRFFQIVYTQFCLFMGKRKGVEVYKQEGRNLSFVEVSSFKHGIFPHFYHCLQHSHIEPLLHNLVLFNKQRYEFFSKSQLSSTLTTGAGRCCSISKDTNFSANHNKSGMILFSLLGVVQ